MEIDEPCPQKEDGKSVSAQADSDKIINKLIKNAGRWSSTGHTQVQEFIIVKDWW
jgi:hypothetical protein